MQLEDSRLFHNTIRVGVYYVNEKKIPKGLIQLLGSSGVFSSKLNKSTLLSCDLIFVEKKLIKDLNGLELNCVEMDELDSEAMSNLLGFVKNKMMEPYSVRYILVSGLMIKLSKCKDNTVFSRLNQGGRYHYSVKKKMGVYPSCLEDNSYYFIKNDELPRFIRKVSKAFLFYSLEGSVKKYILLIIHVLIFLRKNKMMANHYGLFFSCIKSINETNEVIFKEQKAREEFLKLLIEYKQDDIYFNELESIIGNFIGLVVFKNSALAESALIQHMIFEKDHFCLINTKDQLNNSALGSSDKELINEHAHIISKMILEKGLFNNKVADLIKFHHGHLNGKNLFDVMRGSINEELLLLLIVNTFSQAYLELRPGESFETFYRNKTISSFSSKVYDLGREKVSTIESALFL